MKQIAVRVGFSYKACGMHCLMWLKEEQSSFYFYI